MTHSLTPFSGAGPQGAGGHLWAHSTSHSASFHTAQRPPPTKPTAPSCNTELPQPITSLVLLRKKWNLTSGPQPRPPGY